MFVARCRAASVDEPSSNPAMSARRAKAVARRNLSITIPGRNNGRNTSVSLEPEFQIALGEIAKAEGQSIRAIIHRIAEEVPQGNLSAAIRVFVLEHYRRIFVEPEPSQPHEDGTC